MSSERNSDFHATYITVDYQCRLPLETSDRMHANTFLFSACHCRHIGTVKGISSSPSLGTRIDL
eukprot:2435-Pelagococcus_subviridis.AAC.11